LRHVRTASSSRRRSLPLAAAGAALWSFGWPATAPAAGALAIAAAVALRAAWKWERTRVLVTTERLIVVSGTLRRRRADVPLARVASVEVEQGLIGRMLGYGTVIAGELEIPYVADPRHVAELAAR
jgi:membrane protein YdbS with pleckstrin-like domain